MPEKKYIDKVFREKLGNYRKEPPEDAWLSIREGINNKRGRKAIMLAWRIAAGIALIITAGYLYFSVKIAEKPLITREQGIKEELHIKKDTVHQTTETSEKVERQIIEVKPLLSENDPVAHKSIELTKAENGLIEISQKDSGFMELPADLEKIPSSDIRVYLADIPYALNPLWIVTDTIPDRTEFSSEINENLRISEVFNDETAVKKDLWSISAQMSPLYSYRSLGPGDQAAITSLNESESGKLNYGGGLQIGYKASERLSLYAGLMYSKVGLEVNNLISISLKSYVDFGTGIIENAGNRTTIYTLNNSTGVIGSDQINEIRVSSNSGDRQFFNSQTVTQEGITFIPNNSEKIDQYFQFLEFPLLLRYKVLSGKFNMNLLGGVSTNLLIGNSVYLLSGDNKTDIGHTQGIRTVNYSGNVGFGFDYDLGKNFLFTIEPQFRYYLNSINERDLISNRPYSLGMYTGIRYIF